MRHVICHVIYHMIYHIICHNVMFNTINHMINYMTNYMINNVINHMIFFSRVEVTDCKMVFIGFTSNNTRASRATGITGFDLNIIKIYQLKRTNFLY